MIKVKDYVLNAILIYEKIRILWCLFALNNFDNDLHLLLLLVLT